MQLAEYELLILSQNRFFFVSFELFNFQFSVKCLCPFSIDNCIVRLTVSEFNLIFRFSLNTVVLNQKLKTVSNYSQALLLRSEVSCSYRKNLHVNLHGRQDT